MAVVASDDFNDLADAASPNGRTLNNGLGGSGTRSWVTSSVSGVDSGSLVFAAAGQCRVDYGTAADLKAKVSIVLNGTNKNWVVFGRGPSSGNTSMFGLLLVGASSLRVAEWDGAGSRTDRATKAITALSTTTTYKLQFEIDGLVCTARVLNADNSLYDEVSYTAGATPGGAQQYWGFLELFATNPNQSRLDDFVLEDLGGGGTTTPLTLAATGAGVPRIARQASLTRAATGTATPRIVKQASLTLAATGVGVATVVKKASLALAATARGAPTVTRLASLALAATGTAAVTISVLSAASSVVAAAVGVGVAALSMIVYKLLGATAAGLPTVTTDITIAERIVGKLTGHAGLGIYLKAKRSWKRRRRNWKPRGIQN